MYLSLWFCISIHILLLALCWKPAMELKQECNWKHNQLEHTTFSHQIFFCAWHDIKIYRLLKECRQRGKKQEKNLWKETRYSNYLWLYLVAELGTKLLTLGLTLDKYLGRSGSVLDTKENVQTASEGTWNLRCIIKECGFSTVPGSCK